MKTNWLQSNPEKPLFLARLSLKSKPSPTGPTSPSSIPLHSSNQIARENQLKTFMNTQIRLKTSLLNSNNKPTTGSKLSSPFQKSPNSKKPSKKASATLITSPAASKVSQTNHHWYIVRPKTA